MTLENVGTVLVSSVERAPWGWALLATSWAALWRYGAPMAAVIVAYAEKVRSEKRIDTDSCQARIDAMDVRLTTAENRSHSFEMKLVGALAAYRILDVEVAKLSPKSTAREQAAAVLRDTFTITPSTPNEVADAIDSGHPERAF